MDSLLPSRHDAFRGVHGAWKATLSGIDAARKAGLGLQLQMTLTPQTLAEMGDLIRFSIELDARSLAVFFLVCTGRGQDTVDLAPE
ncbi:MAG: hypothetical protein HYU36_19265 [Planctomycetes bacterium]|nr:hypothetical protein [Planctomycetota bacterium]